MGFDANGIISALDIKAWCLAGAFMDLAWNDLYGVMTGLDQVGPWLVDLQDNSSVCSTARGFCFMCTVMSGLQGLRLCFNRVVDG